MIWKGIALAAVAGFAAYLAVAIGDRSDPVTIDNIEAVKPAIAPGEPMQVRFMFDRHRACRLHVEHWVFEAAAPHRRSLLRDLDFASLPGPLGKAPPIVDEYPVPATFRGRVCYARISSFICNWAQVWWPIVLDRGVGHGQACVEIVEPK